MPYRPAWPRRHPGADCRVAPGRLASRSAHRRRCRDCWRCSWSCFASCRYSVWFGLVRAGYVTYITFNTRSNVHSGHWGAPPAQPHQPGRGRDYGDLISRPVVLGRGVVVQAGQQGRGGRPHVHRRAHRPARRARVRASAESSLTRTAAARAAAAPATMCTRPNAVVRHVGREQGVPVPGGQTLRRVPVVAGRAPRGVGAAHRSCSRAGLPTWFAGNSCGVHHAGSGLAASSAGSPLHRAHR